jgi:hypothetical protein
LKEMQSGVPAKSPSLSAIVVIPDKYETVRTTMSYLKKQTVAELIEIVLVAPSPCRSEIDQEDLSSFHSWKFVPLEKIQSIASGFVAGILRASAPVVGLTEDHAYPDSRWAESFIKAHKQPWAVVCPSMRNGNPVNLISWADYYQAYGQWNELVSSGPIDNVPGHNSSYKKDILLSFGGELNILMQAESVLHRKLKEKGYEFSVEASTCTSHLNFISWSSWIPARYYAGKQFAGTWAHSWPWIRRLAYTLASPGIPILRFLRTQQFVFKRHNLLLSLRILLIIFIGFVVEAFGNMLGFLAGVGDASYKIGQYEFHRINT